MSDPINILTMRKGEQRFAFLYTDAQRTQLLGELGKMAADPHLDFSWYDAAVLGQRVREIPCESTESQISKSRLPSS